MTIGTTTISAPAAQWNALLAKHDSALAAYLAKEEYADAHAETFCAALQDLLTIPAPDTQALAWKIRQLLHTDTPSDCTDPFTGKIVAQTLADVDRLIVDDRA